MLCVHYSNQQSNTKKAVASRFDVAVSRPGLSTKSSIVEENMSEITKWLQGFAMWKLQGNNVFWKAGTDLER